MTVSSRVHVTGAKCVVVFHTEMDPGCCDSQPIQSATWIPQTCRTAHRAGVPGPVLITGAPWAMTSLAGLRRLKYVMEADGGKPGRTKWRTSEAV